MKQLEEQEGGGEAQREAARLEVALKRTEDPYQSSSDLMGKCGQVWETRGGRGFEF